ncbi:FAD-binding oxidoreductase [Ensifer soli]|uniref:FAD-binding oxidoreductase n=1 Tax=Ciceribacter sp. sgz301302 TaxID=3342379 RepID=UPI0035B8D785
MAIEPQGAADAGTALVCVDVHEETADVRTFTFVAADGRPIAFEAGQYLSFDVAIDGARETRCYSFSSSPLRRNAVSVTVKRVPGGKVSNWFHDTVTAGTTLAASGPLGRFVRPAGDKYLFLSGGSGITPVMAMVRELADHARPVDAVFLHAARTPRDLVFRADLARLAERLKGLRLILLPETLAGEPSWPGLSGRISPALMALAVPDLTERTVLCCGPAPFMAQARRIAEGAGVAPGRYIEESFEPAAEAPAPVAAGERLFRVEFAKQKRMIEVAAGQTVLSVARKAGVRLPSSCANGLCGTCKSTLVSGRVDMAHNGGIRQREIDAGLFLPCCSRPLSDLVIDR